MGNKGFLCWRCGHAVIWDADNETNEVVSSMFHCQHCGAAYELWDTPDEEKENYDFFKE